VAGVKRGLGEVTGEGSEEELVDSSSSEEEEEVEGAGVRAEEPRLKIEKEPASFWRDYVDLVTQGKAQRATLKLNTVKAKISEIIFTAEQCGYKEKLAKWRQVKEDLERAVSKNEAAAYQFRA
jgi:hypothetical protein